MVNDVQVRNLVEFFAHDEKDGVEEFGELAQVVAVTQKDDPLLIDIIFGIVDRLAAVTVAPKPSVDQALQFI